MLASSSGNRLLPSLAVAICGAAWGAFWIPLRWLEQMGVGGAWSSLVFFAVAALCALPWLIGRKAAWPGLADQLLAGTLLGTAFTFYTVSLVMTDVIHAILLFYLTPVWSTLAGLALLGERLTWSRGLAMILGFTGMGFVLGLEDGLPLPRSAGDWIGLAAGMLWAAGTIRSFYRPAHGIAVPVFTFSVGGMSASGLILIVAWLWASPLASAGNMLAALPWMIVVALAIFVPPNAMVLWAAQRIDSGRVGILLMTEVLFGAITAALFSGEAFGVRELTGTALIAGAGLVEVSGRH